MLKTVATLPFAAALLASNSIGLELVTRSGDEDVETATLDALYSSLTISGASNDRQRSGREGAGLPRSSFSRANLDSTSLEASRQRPRRRSTLTSDAASVMPKGSDDEWRPVFDQSERGMRIRRLYPAKTHGRAHLAPIGSSQHNTLGHSRQTSISSTASYLVDSSSHSPTLACKAKSAYSSPFNRSANVITCPAPLSVIESSDGVDLRSSPPRDTHTRKESADTTYGTMKRSESFGVPGMEVFDTGPTGLASPMPLRPALPASAHLNSSPVGSRRSSGHLLSGALPSEPVNLPRDGRGKKGHQRHESIASIWTVDSSPESRGPSPPLHRKKPLLLQIRPAMPDFSREPMTAPIGKTFLDDSSAADQRPSRPPIPPRSSSRQSSTHSARPKSMPISGRMYKTLSSQPTESWDDDFGEAEVEVPTSVRHSQATVRNHLWQFHRFAELISKLKRLKMQRQQGPSTNLAPSHPAWHETDAIIAIASRGEESETADEIAYSGAQDDTISRILNQFRRDGGKVRLDGEVLATLIDKASALVVEIERGRNPREVC